MRLCAPHKATNINEPDRTVFYRWMPQSDTGRTARNYEKTEFYFGKNVADYCREHNISSQWITEEQAKNMNIKNQSKKSLGLMPNFLPQNGQYKISNFFIYRRFNIIWIH